MLSSLTTVLSSALVFSTRPPVSVYGTDNFCSCYEDFLGSIGSVTSLRVAPSLAFTSRNNVKTDLPIFTSYGLSPLTHYVVDLPFSVSPSLKRTKISTGILTCFPSTTPFGLILGSGLPWEDDPGPGNLGLTAGGFLALLIVTDVSILTCLRSTRPYGRASPHRQRSSTTLPIRRSIKSIASVSYLSPVEFSAQADLTSELLRFL